MDRNRVNSEVRTSHKFVYARLIKAAQRLIRQTFILDMKHYLLHGGEPNLTPFDLNLRLCWSEDAWYATSSSEWAHFLSLNGKDAIPFVDILKMLWNPRANALPAEKVPRGSNIVLYGLVSIARELCRRKYDHIPDQSGDTLTSLGTTFGRSLNNWEHIWNKIAVPKGLTSRFLWRSCSCIIHLARTLYEISPIDLQTVAGKDIIEGKRRGAADYARSRRKISRWAKQDRALVGVSGQYFFSLALCDLELGS